MEGAGKITLKLRLMTYYFQIKRANFGHGRSLSLPVTDIHRTESYYTEGRFHRCEIKLDLTYFLQPKDSTFSG